MVSEKVDDVSGYEAAGAAHLGVVALVPGVRKASAPLFGRPFSYLPISYYRNRGPNSENAGQGETMFAKPEPGNCKRLTFRPGRPSHKLRYMEVQEPNGGLKRQELTLISFHGSQAKQNLFLLVDHQESGRFISKRIMPLE